ncbi:MAG: DUF927 domain-containing protein [Chloroflexi bacterium]|nr:MAG: DUF927 domain-containing protein [Chloroflexota bacterium]
MTNSTKKAAWRGGNGAQTGVNGRPHSITPPMKNQSTAARVLDYLRSRQDLHLKPQHEPGKFHLNSPLRPGSDSDGFVLTISDDEHGVYFDHVTKESGTLYDLADRLGIGRPHPNSKRKYQSLADYAQEHGAPADVFIAAGWKETTYQGRPALAFKTKTGTRYRFLDGQKPHYKSPARYRPCWYGLARAVEITAAGGPLVICNGEASTVTAQYYGLAAVCLTGGERGKIPEHLLNELQEAYSGPVVVAFDCDQAGRTSAARLVEQLQDAGYQARAVDLAGSNGFDLADFCKLHGHQAAEKLHTLKAISQQNTSPATPINELGYYTITDEGYIQYHGPARHTQKGVYYPTPEIVADFWAKLVHKQVIYDDRERTVIYTLYGEKDGKEFTAKIPGEIWFDKNKLATALLPYLPGKPPVVESKKQQHWGPAFSYLGDNKESRALASTGWTPDGKSFVAPAGNIGSGWECALNDNLAEHFKGYGFPRGIGDDQTAKNAVRNLLRLTEIYKPEAVYIAIAHAFLPPLLRWLPEARYLLHIQGSTGYGKTEFAKFFMALYGPLGDQAITYKWSDTPVGFESRAYTLKDVLMLIDDYKPGLFNRGSGDEKGWVRNLQAYTSGSGRGRSQKDGAAGKLRPPRCLLISTGEDDLRFDEESIINRTLTVRLTKPSRNKVDTYHQLVEVTAEFHTIMARYIAWLQQTRPPVKAWHKQFLAQNQHINSHLARNMASNLVGAEAVAQFLYETKLLDAVEINRFKDNHDQAINTAIEDTATTAAQQRYSIVFLEAISEALSYGTVYLGEKDIMRSGYIGWYDDDYIYLTPAAVTAANEWLKKNGREIKISNGRLYDQLHLDGYAAQAETKTYRHGDKVERAICLYRTNVNLHLQI